MRKRLARLPRSGLAPLTFGQLLSRSTIRITRDRMGSRNRSAAWRASAVTTTLRATPGANYWRAAAAIAAAISLSLRQGLRLVNSIDSSSAIASRAREFSWSFLAIQPMPRSNVGNPLCDGTTCLGTATSQHRPPLDLFLDRAARRLFARIAVGGKSSWAPNTNRKCDTYRSSVSASRPC